MLNLITKRPYSYLTLLLSIYMLVMSNVSATQISLEEKIPYTESATDPRHNEDSKEELYVYYNGKRETFLLKDFNNKSSQEIIQHYFSKNPLPDHYPAVDDFMLYYRNVTYDKSILSFNNFVIVHKELNHYYITYSETTPLFAYYEWKNLFVKHEDRITPFYSHFINGTEGISMEHFLSKTAPDLLVHYNMDDSSVTIMIGMENISQRLSKGMSINKTIKAAQNGMLDCDEFNVMLTQEVPAYLTNLYKKYHNQHTQIEIPKDHIRISFFDSIIDIKPVLVQTSFGSVCEYYKEAVEKNKLCALAPCLLMKEETCLNELEQHQGSKAVANFIKPGDLLTLVLNEGLYVRSYLEAQKSLLLAQTNLSLRYKGRVISVSCDFIDKYNELESLAHLLDKVDPTHDLLKFYHSDQSSVRVILRMQNNILNYQDLTQGVSSEEEIMGVIDYMERQNFDYLDVVLTQEIPAYLTNLYKKYHNQHTQIGIPKDYIRISFSDSSIDIKPVSVQASFGSVCEYYKQAVKNRRNCFLDPCLLMKEKTCLDKLEQDQGPGAVANFIKPGDLLTLVLDAELYVNTYLEAQDKPTLLSSTLIITSALLGITGSLLLSTTDHQNTQSSIAGPKDDILVKVNAPTS